MVLSSLQILLWQRPGNTGFSRYQAMSVNPSPRQAVLVFFLQLSLLIAAAYHVEMPRATLSPRSTNSTLVDYHIPEPSSILMPDFASIHDIQLKKQAFFDFLQPYIDAKNAEVRRQRVRLQLIAAKLKLNVKLKHEENVLLWDLSRKYEVRTDDLHDTGFIERLLHRVDVLPPSLVLAQAANESAWGTSRFAKEGYNFFGQWCYSDGCGLVPGNRNEDASHEVKSFESVEAAINAYFRNLNTFPSYQDLRLIRQALRQGSKPIDGISLTEGLGKYSERGDAYIQDLQRMIYKNDLLERDKALTP